MADKPFDPDEYLANKPFDPDAYLREEGPQPRVPPEVLEDPNAVAALRLARGVKSPRKASGPDSTIRALENRAEAGAFGAGNAATFGMMNRGIAGLDYLMQPAPTLSDLVTGKPAPSYSDSLARVAGREAEVQKQYPGYHLAGSVLGGVGSGVGLARSGLGISREGLGLAGRVGAGAAEGAAFGAASGAGQTYSGNLPDYIKNSLIGGAFGTVGGAVGEGVGAAAGNIYNRVRDYRSTAFPEPVIRGARADVEGLENLPRLGPEAMLPDAGPSMQATAQQAALGIGPNRTSIVNALMERDLGTVPRLRAAATEHLGPAPRVSQVEDALDANRMRINAEEYTPRLANQAIPPKVGNEMMDVLTNMERQYRINLQPVRDRLSRQGTGPNRADTPDLDPQSWLNARHHIDDMITAAEGKGQKHQAAVLTGLRGEVDRRLAASVPGIKEADAIYAANARAGEALETGGRVLDTGKRAIVPDDLRDLMRTQAVPQGPVPPGPPTANLRLRQGTRADIDRRIGTGRNDLTKLEEILGTPGSYNDLKLNQVFGEPPMQGLRGDVAANRQFRETYQRIAQGSDTAQRQAAAKTADVSAPQMPIRNLAGTAEQLGRMGLAQVMEARKQAQREAIATLMATRDPAEVARLRAELLAHIRAGAPGAARAAQTGRGVLQGVGMGLGPAFEDYLQ